MKVGDEIRHQPCHLLKADSTGSAEHVQALRHTRPIQLQVEHESGAVVIVGMCDFTSEMFWMLMLVGVRWCQLA